MSIFSSFNNRGPLWILKIGSSYKIQERFGIYSTKKKGILYIDGHIKPTKWMIEIETLTFLSNNIPSHGLGSDSYQHSKDLIIFIGVIIEHHPICL